MGRRKLTFEQTEALYDAALSNAYRLCVDALLLLDAGSTGRARALSVLGLEEAGKAVLIQEAKIASFRRGERDPVLDEEFWHAWNHHHPKLRAVRRFVLDEHYWFGDGPPDTHELLLGPIEEYTADLDRFAQNGNASKLAGLYVDVDRSTGKPLTPNQVDADAIRPTIAVCHQIGWQIRLGDHIEFIASQRGRDIDPLLSPYSDYADGGEIARARTNSEGWEFHLLELQSLRDALDSAHD